MEFPRPSPRSETSAADILEKNLEANRQLAAKLDKALALLEKGGNNGNGGWLGKLLTERVIALILAVIAALVVWIGVVNVRYAVDHNEITRNHDDIQKLLDMHQTNGGPRP